MGPGVVVCVCLNRLILYPAVSVSRMGRTAKAYQQNTATWEGPGTLSLSRFLGGASTADSSESLRGGILVMKHPVLWCFIWVALRLWDHAGVAAGGGVVLCQSLAQAAPWQLPGMGILGFSTSGMCPLQPLKDSALVMGLATCAMANPRTGRLGSAFDSLRCVV